MDDLVTCALCGHERILGGCGSGTVMHDGAAVFLCHHDTHSCYHRWTVYGERPADVGVGELLRTAASHVDRIALGTAARPWRAEEYGGGYWMVFAGDRAVTGERLNGCDATWIAGMDPAVAPALSAWLRTAADAADSYRDTAGHLGRMMRMEGQAPAYRHTADHIDAAVTVARALLRMEEL